MSEIKNKHKKIEAPILAGHSDMRTHGYIMLCMVTILIATPFIGFAASAFFVLIFALFGALKTAEYQENHYRSQLLFERAMDRMYNSSKNAEYYEKMLDRYKSRSEIRRIHKARDQAAEFAKVRPKTPAKSLLQSLYSH